jgi:hypothetical protein
MAKQKIPDKLTDDSVLDPEFFRSDLEDIYASIDDIGELASRIDKDLKEKYFDSENRSLYGRGTLSFSSKQMETLASLHSSKNTALNQALRAKLDISKLSLSKRKNDESTIDTEIMAREFQKLFLENQNKIFGSKEKQFEANAKFAESAPMNDDKLDNRINELVNSGKLSFTANELAIKFEKRNVQFRVQAVPNPHFVAIAGDTGEILNDYPVSLMPKNEMLSSAVFNDGVWHCGNGQDYYAL